MGVPAGKRVSAYSGYGYYFVPVVGCGRGCGHGFWLAGADLLSLYPRGFYPLPSIGLLTSVECSRIRDCAWHVPYPIVTTGIGVELVRVQRNYPTLLR